MLSKASSSAKNTHPTAAFWDIGWGTGIILLHSVARKILKTISDRHPKFCEKIAHPTATFWDIVWGLAQCQANLPFHRHLKFFDKIPCPTLSFSENGGHWHYVGAEKNATNQLNLSCHRLCYKNTNPIRALPFLYVLVQ